MRPAHVVVILVAISGFAACVDDPQYVEPRLNLEAGGDGMTGPAEASFTLPIIVERDFDVRDRQALAEQLGMPADQVPYVKVDDLRVELELTVKNLSDEPGKATLKVNGANQFYSYVPINFVVDPEEDEEPPSLLGGYPIEVPAFGQISDTLREDEVREASIDLEIITRGGGNPFAAILMIQEDLEEWQPVAPVDPADPSMGTMPVGDPISIEAFAHILRFDLSFTATQHMVLEIAARVRDHRGIVHDELLDAPPGQLQPFMPMEFTPAGAPP